MRQPVPPVGGLWHVPRACPHPTHEFASLQPSHESFAASPDSPPSRRHPKLAPQGQGGLAILAAEELYISRSADHIQYVHGEWHLKLEVAQGVVLHQVLGRGRRDRTLKLLEPFAQRELVPHRAPHARRANELK